MFRYQGLIDFACLVDGFAGVPVTAAENGLRRVALPGLTLKWNADDVEIAEKDGVIALVAGRVRPSTRSRAEAALWIERYARDGDRAPSDVGGAFAGVIVDVRKRLALLFVDRFSIETLCYRSSNGTLGFSDTACDVPGSSGVLDPSRSTTICIFTSSLRRRPYSPTSGGSRPLIR